MFGGLRDLQYIFAVTYGPPSIIVQGDGGIYTISSGRLGGNPLYDSDDDDA
mgnify:CR=1 FL=1